MIDSKNSKIALVLSGGGALGAAHIGVLRSLENKYVPEYLIGTSAGAIIAGAVACGMSSEEISKFLKQKRLLTVAFDFSFKGSGLIRGNKILELLNQVYEERSFEDLPEELRLRICATDFNTGDLVVLQKGSIAEAVRASIAIPGLFEPYWIDGVPLVDGGLVANMPLANALKEYDGAKIVAVDVCTSMSKAFAGEGAKKVSLRRTIERSLRIIFLQQQKSFPNDERVTMVRPNLEKYSTADILHLTEIEERGYEAGREAILG